MRQIFFDNTILTQDKKSTTLSTDIAAASGTLTVQSIVGFATDQILLVGELGQEGSEIILTHAATSPSGTTVTLASNTVFAHPRGTNIIILDYNQVEVSHASTLTGAKSVLTTTAIQADQKETIYNDTAQAAGYYFVRLKNSIDTTYSDYSDGIPFEGFAENEVGYVLNFVKRKLGHDWDDRFSKQTAIEEINSCLDYIQGRLKHWGRYLVADYVLGQTSRGNYTFTLPSDIYDNETNKSILQVKIGTATEPLTPLDEKEFDEQMRSVSHTQVRTQATAGQTTLEIDNSYDFDNTGSINVYISNTLYTITYTGVTRSATAGVLTGVPASGTGSISVTIPVDTNVWQGESENKPLYFNVRNGSMRTWPLAGSDWQNKNVEMDYNEEATRVDSETDTLDTPRREAVKHWLLWKGKSYWRNNGEDDLKDADFLIFSDILKTAIRNEVSGQKYKMSPKLNSIKYTQTKRGNFNTL